MELPKKLNPSPLASSVVEIRFNSEKSSNEVFKLLYEEFGEDLPNLDKLGPSQDLKKEKPELKYYPDYLLSNDDYSLAFSESYLNIENVSEYQLWSGYGQFVKTTLDRIQKLNVFNEIERIGIRYTSIIENEANVNEIFKVIPNLKMLDFEEKFVAHFAEFKSDDVELYVRIRHNFEGEDPKGKLLIGHLIDIDASVDKEIESKEIFSKIENLHTLTKKMFFGLLKDEFIAKLNPSY